MTCRHWQNMAAPARNLELHIGTREEIVDEKKVAASQHQSTETIDMPVARMLMCMTFKLTQHEYELSFYNNKVHCVLT
jgi:hypothetical protein